MVRCLSAFAVKLNAIDLGERRNSFSFQIANFSYDLSSASRISQADSYSYYK